MLVVIALGGNALLRRGEPLDAEVQRRNVKVAAAVIAEIADQHRVVVTHGNGPQVGLLALQAEAYRAVPAYPLDLLGAESEGMVGYLIQQEIMNRLSGGRVATLLTQVVVDADDPAFAAPTKPIGPVYTERQWRVLKTRHDWTFARDGTGYRRVVPSPAPRRIVEIDIIRLLVEAGVIPVCAGGGGVPVVVEPGGGLRGVEAVADKDRTAALLAAGLDAEALLLLTDVDAVDLDWDTPEARAIRAAPPREMRRPAFAPGTMGPKVEAACAFADATGGVAAIGNLRDGAALLAGAAGTRIERGTKAMSFHD